MKLNKQIKLYFEKHKLDLSKSGQVVSRRDKAALNELRAIAAVYEKETRRPVNCVCQNSINDFLIMLQIYYKKNPVITKTTNQSEPNKPNNSIGT